MKPLLYIAYDGMLEPLGQSQVLAYLERLAGEREIHLLSFEKAEDWQDATLRESTAARIRAAGIHWHPQPYHKRPSAVVTAWDIGAGTVAGLGLVRRHRIGIVHARSYVAAVMALALKRLCNTRFVFDMRGFWADERVDGGLWPADGAMYRVAKAFERRFLLGADHVVSLTRAAVDQMAGFDYLRGRMPPVTVIPTCADLDRFVPGDTPSPGFVLGYVGSAGTWYLFDAVVESFRLLREQVADARLLVINRNEHDYIRERLRQGGVHLADVELRSASHAEVPAQMARMHAGVFFIKPVFSKQASAPTKLGEFLGCGIPCLANRGVGDMASILEEDGVGVAIDLADSAALARGVADLLALAADRHIRERCRAAARKHFSLGEGIARYSAVYQQLDAAG